MARNIDHEGGYENASANGRTLMDYNGPAITEDLGETSDQNLASHVRVKRNEPIVSSSRSVKLVDAFPRNSRRKIDATGEGSCSDREIRAGTIVDTAGLRRKRGVLSKSGFRRKRAKGNVGHLQHRAEIGKGKKKHGALRPSHPPAKKKTSGPSSSTFSSVSHFTCIGGRIHVLLSVIIIKEYCKR